MGSWKFLCELNWKRTHLVILFIPLGDWHYYYQTKGFRQVRLQGPTLKFERKWAVFECHGMIRGTQVEASSIKEKKNTHTHTKGDFQHELQRMMNNNFKINQNC